MLARRTRGALLAVERGVRVDDPPDDHRRRRVGGAHRLKAEDAARFSRIGKSPGRPNRAGALPREPSGTYLGHMPGPAFLHPQLPSLFPKPPAGERWIHEIRHDGYRTQLVLADGCARAFTRGGHDWSDRYPRLVAAVRDLGCRSAVVDGEAVVQDEAGRSDFAALVGALRHERYRIVLFAFDLLHLDGRDLRPLPLAERRAMLRDLLAGRSADFALAYSEEFEGDGADLFAAADRSGLEGIVSKRRDSRYRAGRCDSWVKVKCFTEGLFAVTGIKRTRTGEVNALLADASGAPVGRAFVTLGRDDRERFWSAVRALSDGDHRNSRAGEVELLAPGLFVRVRYIRGEGAMRHATLKEVVGTPHPVG